jgi:hypothetical protein
MKDLATFICNHPDAVTKGGKNRYQLGIYGEDITGMIYTKGNVKGIKVTVEVIE